MKAVAMTLAVLAAAPAVPLADAAPQAYHPDHPDTRRRTQEAAYHPDHPDTRRRTQQAAYHPDHPDTRRLEATESWARTSEQSIPNMNGDYVIGNNKEFPTNYMSYPGGVESFDAYHGPITSTYSQVWWTSWSNELPKDIQQKFDGKVMAIVGVEMDQVRKTPQGDVSVPINIAYNHHHVTSIVGKNSEMETMSREEAESAGLRGHLQSSGDVWAPVEKEPSLSGAPTSAVFDDGNGGEYRKTFHGYAPPFAQLVESPKVVAGTAMQIDTWNREKMNLTGSAFVSGPVPKHSFAPTSGPDAIYSGLLECPLTTRVKVEPDKGSEDFSAGSKPFGQGSGFFQYMPNCTGQIGGCHPWGQIKANRCPEQPRGDLLAQRNPTCDIRTYKGGLQTCLHGWHLLDAEQEIPWADQPLVYYKKFRVYYTEYVPGRHKEITRSDWGIGAGQGAPTPAQARGDDEYTVPQCLENKDKITKKCTHTVTGTWKPVLADGSPNPSGGGGRKGSKVYLAAMHHHCHAPTCLRLDVWNADTSELICRVEPVYGGTGGYVSDDKRFDEPGYVANPPCMFGVNSSFGLPEPVLMNNVTIHVEHVTNSTYGHHGEMGLPQAMLAYDIYE